MATVVVLDGERQNKKRKARFDVDDDGILDMTNNAADNEEDDAMDVEDQEENDASSEEEDDYLQPFMRKAIKKIFNSSDNKYSKGDITEMVLNYCIDNPKQTVVENIVTRVKDLLNTKSKLFEVIDLADGDDSNNSPSRETKKNSSSNTNSTSDIIEVVSSSSKKKPNPIVEILRMFPEAKGSYVEKLLEEHQQSAEIVIDLMMEKGYEKEDKFHSSDLSIQLKKKKMEEKYDFKSNSWETPETYRDQAITELSYNFPFLSPACLPKLFLQNKHHYYHTLHFIEESTGEKPRLSDSALPLPYRYSKEKAAEITEKLKSAGLLKKPFQTRQLIRVMPERLMQSELNEILSYEIAYIIEQRRKQLEDADMKIAEEMNQQLALEENAIYECQCCYNNEYAFEDMVQCTEGDLFCKNCLQHYIEEMVFGKGGITTIAQHKDKNSSSSSSSSMHIPCMNSLSSCPGFYTEYMIEKSLPKKVFEKYTETIMQENIDKAQLTENMIKCHACDLLYEKPEMPNDNTHKTSSSSSSSSSSALPVNTVFQCVGCQAKTCLLCGQESHIPLKCSEVEKKEETAQRLTLEEAMAEARIRECPKCHKRFYKTEGCNKMTCACGTRICYLCRANITKEGYQHFCSTPHCDHKKCNKCLLHSNTVDDDRRAMLEAGLKVLEVEIPKGIKLNELSINNLNLDGEKKAALEKLLEGGLKGLDKKAQPGLPIPHIAPPQFLPQAAGPNFMGFLPPLVNQFVRPLINNVVGYMQPHQMPIQPPPPPAVNPFLHNGIPLPPPQQFIVHAPPPAQQRGRKRQRR
mmetsp:Transcript_16774/g.18190  ORF Transcript_16774/g.18190 Transcript_16774/m.18190 type:complete len:803 (+) Transcript_16774:67-2475(+)